MQKILWLAVILCQVLISTGTYAQTELYQLTDGEYSIGIGFRFPEDMRGLAGNFNYAISSKIMGLAGAGLLFSDQDSDLTGVSTPPIKVFRAGTIASDRLGRTGLNYWATLNFGLTFEKLISDNTDETISTSQEMMLSGGVGLMKKISMESGIILAPLAGIYNAHAWTTTELDITDSIEREDENTWCGQMGLIAQISPSINIGGKVVFSFEESDISYHLDLVLRP